MNGKIPLKDKCPVAPHNENLISIMWRRKKNFSLQIFSYKFLKKLSIFQNHTVILH